MKTVIFCGHATSGCDEIHRAAVAMGLAQPVRSARGGLLPGELQDKLLALSETDAGHGGPDAGGPGKLGHELAADLFLANAESGTWGWCDSRHAALLEFWHSFDPRIRFVLAYTPPEFALHSQLHDPAANLAGAVQEWARFNQALLRFYLGNQERCVLVNTRSPALSGPVLAGLLDDRLGVPLAPEHWHRPSPTGDAIEALVARQLLADSADLADIFHSLESVADVSYGYDAAESEATAALLQLRGFDLKVADMNAAVTHAREDAGRQLEEAGRINEGLQAQLRESQDELDRFAARVEEFIEAQNAVPPPPTATCMAVEQFFDARRGFTGDNWYGPEDDGRWAGPQEVSTVRLPVLAPSRYSLSMDVAAAMAPDIAEGIRFFLNGSEIALAGLDASMPAILTGEFTVAEAGERDHFELQFRFPRTESPAEQGIDPDDHRKLAIRLRSITVRPLEPQP